jgi:hypothetical protein
MDFSCKKGSRLDIDVFKSIEHRRDHYMLYQILDGKQASHMLMFIGTLFRLDPTVFDMSIYVSCGF